MYIVNCPFNKIQILWPAMIGLANIFLMMHSNLGLNSRETVPLKSNDTVPLIISSFFLFQILFKAIIGKSLTNKAKQPGSIFVLQIKYSMCT